MKAVAVKMVNIMSPNSLHMNIDAHIAYAKEIGSNMVGRRGPKETAYLLALEVERLRKEVYNLRYHRTQFDCCYTMGNVAETGGSHCPIDNPCQKCEYERRIAELERGEFICKKCGLRKDSQTNGDF